MGTYFQQVVTVHDLHGFIIDIKAELEKIKITGCTQLLKKCCANCSVRFPTYEQNILVSFQVQWPSIYIIQDSMSNKIIEF